jgi:hypothetical protein
MQQGLLWTDAPHYDSEAGGLTLTTLFTGSCCANFQRAMELEHCSKPVSSWQFTTSNYGVVTNVQAEWNIVLNADSEEVQSSPALAMDGRIIPRYKNLLKLDQSTKAGLEQAEVIAVILYTGPMVRDPLLMHAINVGKCP